MNSIEQQLKLFVNGVKIPKIAKPCTLGDGIVWLKKEDHDELLNLFDTASSNGASQGIGNWGLMGTGIWNANGYVPAQLDPWCRMYLNWEPVITVISDTENIPVDYFLNQNPSFNRLYKLPISSTEYFLVENRQQNPDGSTDPYTGLPSYSFVLLPEGEQDYYEYYPLLPYFNFIENRYKGSEWDFMLPGLGGPIP